MFNTQTEAQHNRNFLLKEHPWRRDVEIVPRSTSGLQHHTVPGMQSALSNMTTTAASVLLFVDVAVDILGCEEHSAGSKEAACDRRGLTRTPSTK
jgi:hypothetical protein